MEQQLNRRNQFRWQLQLRNQQQQNRKPHNPRPPSQQKTQTRLLPKQQKNPRTLLLKAQKATARTPASNVASLPALDGDFCLDFSCLSVIRAGDRTMKTLRLTKLLCVFPILAVVLVAAATIGFPSAIDQYAPFESTTSEYLI